MAESDDHYGVENQHEKSFAAGRSVGLFEAALSVLDNTRLDPRTRFHAASMLKCRTLGRWPFSPLFSPTLGPGPDDLDEPQGEVTEADLAEVRDDVGRRLRDCLLDFGDHFSGGG